MFQSLAYIWFVVQLPWFEGLNFGGEQEVHVSISRGHLVRGPMDRAFSPQIFGGGPKPGPLAQAGIDRAFGPQNQNGKGRIRPDRICQAPDMDWHATFLFSPAYVFNANGVAPYQPGATPQVPISQIH